RLPPATVCVRARITPGNEAARRKGAGPLLLGRVGSADPGKIKRSIFRRIATEVPKIVIGRDGIRGVLAIGDQESSMIQAKALQIGQNARRRFAGDAEKIKKIHSRQLSLGSCQSA